MNSSTGIIICFLCSLVMVGSKPLYSDSDGYDEDDRYGHVWTAPDLRGTGLVAVDGDIVVRAGEAYPEMYSRKGIDFNSWTKGFLKWPGGVVSYWFALGMPSRHRRIIKDAMVHWEENTCLRFRPAGLFQFTCYLNFRYDREGCYSLVGRKLFPQDINLGVGCVKHRTAIHEIGHAVGLFHEQSRRDRDKFIKILWENVDPSMKNQFRKLDDNPRGVPYDYRSVMQYSELSFTSDIEKNTIVTLDPFMQLSLGGANLTFRDRKLANAMYECDEMCPNRHTLRCENEGFMFQRHGHSGDCSCVCPPNTAGERCEIILNRNYYHYPECRGNVTTEGTIQTPNAPKTLFGDGGCIFWIQAPRGKRPQVEFSFFSYGDRRRPNDNPKLDPKCQAERVEIRTESLHEGHVYCSKDLEAEKITATTANMIIIASPKYAGAPGGFIGNVRFVD